jgi:hypothetical protein
MTMRAHGKAWNEFSRWCQARKLKSLPAHAWTVAAYVRWCEPRHDYPAIVTITKAIARRHLINGHPDPERNPMVKRTMAMIERRIANSHQRSALFDEEILKEDIENPDETEALFEEPAKSRSTKRVFKSMSSSPKLVRRRPR